MNLLRVILVSAILGTCVGVSWLFPQPVMKGLVVALMVILSWLAMELTAKRAEGRR